MTEWRKVQTPPYGNYEVSDNGDVRRDGRLMVGYFDRYGYRTVLLSHEGTKLRFKVHRLVCEAFHGPPPEGMECGHLDSVKSNNRASNLAWITRSENEQHNIARGTRRGGNPGGDHHPSAKLTADIVAIARERHKAGESGRKLAKEFGVTSATMSKALSGKAWKSAPTGCAQTHPGDTQ